MQVNTLLLKAATLAAASGLERSSLLVGVAPETVAALPVKASPLDQCLSDLNALWGRARRGETGPLRAWNENLARLAPGHDVNNVALGLLALVDPPLQQAARAERLGSVLWVDDLGPEGLAGAAAHLEAWGWEVLWAESVFDAAQVLALEPVTAMLLDQMLPTRRDGSFPEKDGGLKLLAWLRGEPGPAEALPGVFGAFSPAEVNRQIPVAVLSAYFDDATAQATQRHGGPIPFFMKPPDVHRLRRFLMRAVGLTLGLED
ncbi:MAG: response regulator [Myxococcales bacterium]|nr:response regulator [Myxococcales bacterium]